MEAAWCVSGRMTDAVTPVLIPSAPQSLFPPPASTPTGAFPRSEQNAEARVRTCTVGARRLRQG